VADAIYLMTQAHQEKLSQLDQQASRDREVLERDITETRKVWQQDQEEFDASLEERLALQTQQRQQQDDLDPKKWTQP